MKHRYLVIDDDLTFAETLVRRLRRRGHEAELATEADAALDHSRVNWPDIMRWAWVTAVFSSNAAWAFSIRPIISPIPRMRDARRPGS